jgi:hypothetical protein
VRKDHVCGCKGLIVGLLGLHSLQPHEFAKHAIIFPTDPDEQRERVKKVDGYSWERGQACNVVMANLLCDGSIEEGMGYCVEGREGTETVASPGTRRQLGPYSLSLEHEKMP